MDSVGMLGQQVTGRMLVPAMAQVLCPVCTGPCTSGVGTQTFTGSTLSSRGLVLNCRCLLAQPLQQEGRRLAVVSI